MRNLCVCAVHVWLSLLLVFAGSSTPAVAEDCPLGPLDLGATSCGDDKHCSYAKGAKRWFCAPGAQRRSGARENTGANVRPRPVAIRGPIKKLSYKKGPSDSAELAEDKDRSRKISSRIGLHNSYIALRVRVERLRSHPFECSKRSAFKSLSLFAREKRDFFSVAVAAAVGQGQLALSDNSVVYIPIILESDNYKYAEGSSATCEQALISDAILYPPKLAENESIQVRFRVIDAGEKKITFLKNIVEIGSIFFNIFPNASILSHVASEGIKAAVGPIQDKINAGLKGSFKDTNIDRYSFRRNYGVSFIAKDFKGRPRYRITISHEPKMTVFGETPLPPAEGEYIPDFSSARNAPLEGRLFPYYTDTFIRPELQTLKQILRLDQTLADKLAGMESANAEVWHARCGDVWSELKSQFGFNNYDLAGVMYELIVKSKYKSDASYRLRGCPDARVFRVMKKLEYDIEEPGRTLRAPEEDAVDTDKIAGVLIPRIAKAGKSATKNLRYANYLKLWDAISPNLFDNDHIFGARDSYKSREKISDALATRKLEGFGCYVSGAVDTEGRAFEGKALGVFQKEPGKLERFLFDFQVAGSSSEQISIADIRALNHCKESDVATVRSLVKTNARSRACKSMARTRFREFTPLGSDNIKEAIKKRNDCKSQTANRGIENRLTMRLAGNEN